MSEPVNERVEELGPDIDGALEKLKRIDEGEAHLVKLSGYEASMVRLHIAALIEKLEEAEKERDSLERVREAGKLYAETGDEGHRQNFWIEHDRHAREHPERE